MVMTMIMAHAAAAAVVSPVVAGMLMLHAPGTCSAAVQQLVISR
jgi:hypothetical protein